MKNKKYVTTTNNYNGKDVKLNVNKLDGLEIKPKNKISYGDLVEVNSMLVVNPNLIEKVLKKKTKRKLDFYLKYIVSLIESDDNDDTNLALALDDLAHYKSIVEYKYRKYLDEKYTNLLLRKIDILENEIRMKMTYQMSNIYEEEEISRKVR